MSDSTLHSCAAPYPQTYTVKYFEIASKNQRKRKKISNFHQFKKKNTNKKVEKQFLIVSRR